MSPVSYHFFFFMPFFFYPETFDKGMELVGGGPVINKAYPVLFVKNNLTPTTDEMYLRQPFAVSLKLWTAPFSPIGLRPD